MTNRLSLQQEEDVAFKKQVVATILADLPEWFGLPDATKEYIDNCARWPMWVAKVNDKAVGFISLKETSSATAEIYCMGIKKEFHRQGIGQKLVTALEEVALRTYQYLQVKTVAQGHYLIYDQTIAFYQAMGFVELEIFPTLWDEWNPCLILIKAITKKESVHGKN